MTINGQKEMLKYCDEGTTNFSGKFWLSDMKILRDYDFQNPKNLFTEDIIWYVFKFFEKTLESSRNIIVPVSLVPCITTSSDSYHNEGFKNPILWESYYYPKIADNPTSTYHLVFNIPTDKHWNYAAINCKERLVIIYDPLGNNNYIHTMEDSVKIWLMSEDEDPKCWRFHTNGGLYGNPYKLPEQTDESNCGIFVCLAAMYFMLKAEKSADGSFNALSQKFPKETKYRNGDLIALRERFIRLIFGEEEEVDAEYLYFTNFFLNT